MNSLDEHESKTEETELQMTVMMKNRVNVSEGAPTKELRSVPESCVGKTSDLGGERTRGLDWMNTEGLRSIRFGVRKLSIL